MKSVAYRIANAKTEINAAVNIALQKYELPAYICENILGDILADLRQAARIELISEIERETNVDLEQGVHKEKLGKQTVKKNTDK